MTNKPNKIIQKPIKITMYTAFRQQQQQRIKKKQC